MEKEFRKLMTVAICFCLLTTGCGSKQDQIAPVNETETIETTQEITSASETESIKINKETAPVTAARQNTYMNNEYYDVIEASTYNNSLGHTVMIHKVLAKQDVSITGKVIAYEDDRSTVIDKSTDEITLTAGQYNFLRYGFDGDVSNVPIQPSAKVETDDFLLGDRNAVEMVQYNQHDNHLYITFKQVAEELGPFAKFKLLFYKDDKIVDTTEGFFATSTKNLNGIGTSDVAEISVYNIDSDRFEYIFEP